MAAWSLGSSRRRLPNWLLLLLRRCTSTLTLTVNMAQPGHPQALSLGHNATNASGSLTGMSSSRPTRYSSASTGVSYRCNRPSSRTCSTSRRPLLTMRRTPVKFHGELGRSLMCLRGLPMVSLAGDRGEGHRSSVASSVRTGVRLLELTFLF